MLLMDLFHMIGFFLDRGFQPQRALFGRPVTSRAICAGLCIVIPGRIRNEEPASIQSM